MHGDEKYIFDIAVYSVTSEKFFMERQKKLEKYFDRLNSMLPTELKRNINSNDNYDMEMRDYFKKKYGGWQFTQVVGWIRLFPLVHQMRGECWFVNSKKIDIHMNRKKFEYFGKAFELTYFTGKETSGDIFHQIKERIEDLKKDKLFKRRYIDMENLINIGPFVDWRKLMGLD